jgi:hypothetical protein
MAKSEQYCKVCGRIHSKETLGIYATKEETDSLALINNKISCAAQAARPDAIPQGVDPERAKLFVQAAIDSLGVYRWLEQDWWRGVKKVYALPENVNVFLDFNTGEFYMVTDKHPEE